MATSMMLCLVAATAAVATASKRPSPNIPSVFCLFFLVFVRKESDQAIGCVHTHTFTLQRHAKCWLSLRLLTLVFAKQATFLN